MRRRFPAPGGFCCRCEAHRNTDGQPVTKKCVVCKGFVCSQCTLEVVTPGVFGPEVYCSKDCMDVMRIQRAMLNLPLDKD